MIRVPRVIVPGVLRAGQIRMAILKLREARDLLAGADCRQATPKVRAALKSAEGAERNAINQAARLLPAGASDA